MFNINNIIEKSKQFIEGHYSNINDIKAEILQFEQELNKLSDSYTDGWKRDEIACKQQKILKKISFLYTLLNLSKLDSKLLEFKLNSDTLIQNKISENNWLYIKKNKENNIEYFQNLLKYPLDDEQQTAILTDECNTLVIAGAGCGKTSTILGKIKYLLEQKKILPEDIVVLSYSNDSVNELNQRFKENNVPIEAQTFHSFAHKKYLSKINIDKNPSAKLNQAIISYFKNVTDRKAQKEILKFFTLDIYTLTENKEIIKEQFQDEKIETIKSKIQSTRNIKENYTIKHEFVSSKEEVVIANLLYLNGIDYIYEKRYPKNIISENGTEIAYNPDFYLPEYNIYIEHFGVNLKEKATNDYDIENYDASHLGKDSTQYIQRIKTKRELHKKYGTKLIESYSFWNSNNDFETKLLNLLKNNGVKFRKLPDNEIKDVYTNYVITEATNKALLFEQFINLFKANGFTSVDEFKSRNRVEKLFFSIIKGIYTTYQDALGDKLDFNDIINKARSYINSTEISKFKYLVIDEFQDINKGRYLFIKEIEDKIKCKIFAVGDDWQSIYRFAGSDVSLFKNFTDCFGKNYSATTFIQNTYRNSQNLIDIAGTFIMSNPSQVKKSLKSHANNVTRPITIYEGQNYGKEFYQAILDITAKGQLDTDILVLARYNNANKVYASLAGELCEDFIFNKDYTIESKKYPNLKIKFMTCHKSKGLEATNVIILVSAGEWGFPNQIADNPMLRYVLSESDKYLFAEERRLFYVALTRAKKNVYIISKPFYQITSPFVKEIKQILVKQITH